MPLGFEHKVICVLYCIMEPFLYRPPSYYDWLECYELYNKFRRTHKREPKEIPLIRHWSVDDKFVMDQELEHRLWKWRSENPDYQERMQDSLEYSKMLFGMYPGFSRL